VSIVFLVRVQCRRKESSRSLSHLLMSFLSCLAKLWRLSVQYFRRKFCGFQYVSYEISL